jgi:hypothetical protein
MTKTTRFLALFRLNAIIVVTIIFFQYLMFSFLPALDPATSASERRAIATNIIIGKCAVLIAELSVGLLIAFLIQKRALMLPLKLNIWILSIDLVIVLTSLLVFSFDYMNRAS